MNTQRNNDRKKTQRQKAGHRQAVTKKQDGATVLHIYMGSHEQEHPETRMTR